MVRDTWHPMSIYSFTLQIVEDMGPIWCSSCFYFEDWSGQLRSLFHWSQHLERDCLPNRSSHRVYQKRQGLWKKDVVSKIFLKRRWRKSLKNKWNICKSFSCLQMYLLQLQTNVYGFNERDEQSWWYTNGAAESFWR